jgi:hypothetical protein
LHFVAKVRLSEDKTKKELAFFDDIGQKKGRLPRFVHYRAACLYKHERKRARKLRPALLCTIFAMSKGQNVPTDKH